MLVVRKAAEKSLLELARKAWPALDEALQENPSAEVTRAIGVIKDPANAVDARVGREQLARLRAIMALERSGSRLAEEVLATIAQGDNSQRETWFAGYALKPSKREAGDEMWQAPKATAAMH